MEWLDLVIRLFVVGLSAWAIRWGIGQKIQALEQKIPAMPDCHSQHEKIKEAAMKECTNELKHVQELIAQKLTQGEKQFEKAMQIYVKILQINPQDLEVLMAIGYICENLNRVEDARDFYNRILDIEPWNLEARQKLDALNVTNMAV